MSVKKRLIAQFHMGETRPDTTKRPKDSKTRQEWLLLNATTHAQCKGHTSEAKMP